jgi:hypothetical protein
MGTAMIACISGKELELIEDEHVHPDDAVWVDRVLDDLGVTRLPPAVIEGGLRVFTIRR